MPRAPSCSPRACRASSRGLPDGNLDRLPASDQSRPDAQSSRCPPWSQPPRPRVGPTSPLTWPPAMSDSPRPKRSAAAVAKALAAAYAADRGFDVPVVVFRASGWPRSRAGAASWRTSTSRRATLRHPLPRATEPAAARAIESLDLPGTAASWPAVRHTHSWVATSTTRNCCGPGSSGPWAGTARTLAVLEAVARKWAE